MDDGSTPMISFAIFAVLLVLNAMLYGFSVAIQSISLKAPEEYDERQRKKIIKLEKIIDAPGKYVLTLRAVTTIVALFAGGYQLGIYAGWLRKWLVNVTGLRHYSTVLCVAAYIVIGIVCLWMILLFGILIPKKLGHLHSEKWAFSICNLAYLIMVLLTPITLVVNGLASGILKICGIDSAEIEERVTEEDIVSMVNEGHEKGVFLASEAEMITNIFEFSDKEVKDIMTHRTNIVAVDGNITLNEAVAFMLQETYSRFPVYLDDIDNIIGIIHLKDTMIFHEQDCYDSWRLVDIEKLIRQVEFIPETRNINVVFKDMQREKLHMQIVIDEYGQTSGIVAMEDILEEIVGNIQDEYDEEEENILQKDENTYLVNGMTTLEELNDRLGISIEDEDYDTVNGYLISKLDRILSEGEHPELEIDGILYKVLEVRGKMISKVQLTVTAPEIEKSEKEDE